MIRRLVLAGCLGLTSSASAETLRLMTYNLLNYPGTTGNSREDDFRVVLTEVQPDVLVVQEVTSSSGATEFLNDVLLAVNPGEWAMVPFTLGPDTNNACYYRTAKLDYQGGVIITTSLRNINGYIFQAGGFGIDGEFRFYSLHLKAGSTANDESQRLSEATLLRNHLNGLPGGTHIAVAGDFNIGTSSEAAWVKMTGSEADNDGRLFDPINRVGAWNNNAAYADVHTQSSRVGSIGDGGASGGLDDRFDMILLNDDLLNFQGLDYLAGSYQAIGQDGQHFNQSVNNGFNAAVSAAVADALYFGSDHLPVALSFELPPLVPSQMVVSGDLGFGTLIEGALLARPLFVQNLATPPADDLDYTLSSNSPAFEVPAGNFSLDPGNQELQLVTLNSSFVGAHSATVTVAGDDPANPSDSFPATATVLQHARPSTVAGVEQLAYFVSFGAQPQGQFTIQPFEVYNYGYSLEAFQALLEPYAVSTTGPDSAYFSVPGFTPQPVGISPAVFQVHFNDVAADSARVYTATLRMQTRDQQDLVGAANRADLTWTVIATITEINTAVGERVVARNWLYENVPNPFNPATSIAFDLLQGGRTSLEIYNVRGRLVRTMLDRHLASGSHRVVWDGRDVNGVSQPSGVYFCRLRTTGTEQTRRMTLLR